MVEDLKEGYVWTSSSDGSSSNSSSAEEEGVPTPSPRPRTPGCDPTPRPAQAAHPSPAVLAWVSKVVAEGGAPAGEEEAVATPRRGGLAALLAPTALPAAKEDAVPIPGVTAGEGAVDKMAVDTPEGAACPPSSADGGRRMPPSPPPRLATSDGEATVDPGVEAATLPASEGEERKRRRRHRERRQEASAREAAAATAVEEARLTEGRRKKSLKARYRRERARVRAMANAAAAVAPPLSTPPAQFSTHALPTVVRAPPAEPADTAADGWGPGGRPERPLFAGAPLQAGAVGSGRWAWCVACDRPTLQTWSSSEGGGVRPVVAPHHPADNPAAPSATPAPSGTTMAPMVVDEDIRRMSDDTLRRADLLNRHLQLRVMKTAWLLEDEKERRRKQLPRTSG
ncbi:PREDICTED: skin secretory protein xP2-like [Priapulus caudatus]|uniref:Skin secretory protein xP2-like n=1 Tax=Priapulus caudatus TaxID=37621 RepID=A0ABM1F3G7_PRICU|nr:PREDICTED: skin secretory protein xP2-like [Priapulus caudatus]